MVATNEELSVTLGRARRLAMKLGAKAHARLAHLRRAGIRGQDRIVLRDVDTALLFATRARAIVGMLREQGGAAS